MIKKKASQYWPDSRPQSYGKVKVTPLGEEKEGKDGDTIIRRFRISHDESKTDRELVHMQYVGWPDHGVPKDFSSFLRLVQVYRQFRSSSQYQRDGPIVLHCSAGIGRTGTLCAVDILLDYLNRQRLQQEGTNDPTINVFHLVRNLREQRAGMVQSKAQYQFVYDFIAYCIQNHQLGL